jgi:hypothetical protein
VLKIEMHKKAEAKPKQIKVAVGSAKPIEREKLNPNRPLKKHDCSTLSVATGR